LAVNPVILNGTALFSNAEKSTAAFLSNSKMMAHTVTRVS
jgi:hypothetical protein